MMPGIYGEDIKFKRTHARLLREQQITERAPGTIVQDFDTVLDYVRKRRQRVTKRLHQFPLRDLAKINARLQHPLELGLKRPQQKSYPPIHGLYLLLRASGLTYLDETGSTPYLQVDETLANVWQTLNATERYGTLLEIWLLRASEEIVGERARPFQVIPENFEKWRSFANQISVRGKGNAASGDAFDYLSFAPGWHNLGLLDLFGLIEIERGTAVEGEGWQITRFRCTPFGDALLALLYTSCFSDVDWLMDLEAEEVIRPGTLQPVLEPYFPAWKRTLPLPQASAYREGLHIFKVSLGKNCWRRLAIPAEMTFETLAHAILNAYKFDRDHLYSFEYKSRVGTQICINHPYMDEGPWSSEVSIGEAPLNPGQKLTFIYDFGDNWEFDVTLEDITMEEEDTTYPRVLETEGEPPEQYPRWA